MTFNVHMNRCGILSRTDSDSAALGGAWDSAFPTSTRAVLPLLVYKFLKHWF